jgi:DNA processing protein
MVCSDFWVASRIKAEAAISQMLTSSGQALDCPVATSKTYSETIRILALQRSGMTPRLFDALLRRYHGLDEIMALSREDLLEINGLTARMAGKLAAAPKHLGEAQRLADSWAQREITIVSRLEEIYPILLLELNDPPPLLFVRGKVPDAGLKSVSLVGADEASAEGIAMTSRLAREFAARKVQVLSSVIGGIDAAAHLAVIAAGGVAFGVSDCGFDHMPSDERMPLVIDVARHGGIISEFCPDTAPGGAGMRQANRLLVGLSQAVVVTQIHKDSERVLDLLNFCRDIGKLAFLMIDSDQHLLTDEESLRLALECGAIPMDGYDKVADIIRVLV